MHGRLIRTSLGSELYGYALVCTGPKGGLRPPLCNWPVFFILSSESYKVELTKGPYTRAAKVLIALILREMSLCSSCICVLKKMSLDGAWDKI